MKKHRKSFIFGSALLLALIVAGFAFRHKITEVNSGTISVTVMLGPSCPVVREPPDPQCADKPFATDLDLIVDSQNVVSDEHSQVAKEFNSGDDGKFTVHAAPGTYKISSPTSNHGQSAAGLPYCAVTQSITVKANQDTHVSVTCDTGIR